jgi:FKBP12-rapamycin complex-associated protein
MSCHSFALLPSGSNGRDYMFLLKGHEDLRQDERVMQLFGLVNTLLLNDPDTFRRNLTIQVSSAHMLILYSTVIYFPLHQSSHSILLRHSLSSGASSP